MRNLAKKLLYRSGLLGAYHRFRNRNRLTVIMFHRVLRPEDPRWRDADLTWSMPEALFDQYLAFFTSYYNVISLAQLIDVYENRAALPRRPLLITFDDGWADNEEYALACLRKHGLPAVVFVVANGVGKEELWDEALRCSWRRGGLSSEVQMQLWEAAKNGSGKSPAFADCRSPADGQFALELLIRRLAGLDEETRARLISRLVAPVSSGRPHMLSPAQLCHLYERGVSIGSHGLTHAPIPLSPDRRREVEDSRAILAQWLDSPNSAAIVSLSFPHGVYDSQSVAAAESAGYKVLFTSDSHLNPLRRGKPVTRVLGRIHVPGVSVIDAQGDLRPELLAIRLFTANVGID